MQGHPKEVYAIFIHRLRKLLRSLFSFAVILPRKHRQLLNNKFPEWGIRFIDAADNADTESERYGTLRLFTGAYNEMYVRDISAKLRRTV